MADSISQYIVLVEDWPQRSLVQRYLDRCGVHRRKLHFVALPASRGSGEQYVRENYAKQVKALRLRQARARTGLVVMIDADTSAVARRYEQMATALNTASEPARLDDEPIVILVPKRHVETWIARLNSRPVNEDEDFTKPVPSAEEIVTAATVLRQWVVSSVPDDCLSSLKRGIDELAQRLRD